MTYIQDFDSFWSTAFRSASNPVLDVCTHFLTAITYGGALWVVLAYFLWRRGYRLLAVQIGIAIVIALIESSTVKHIFHRARPTTIELYQFWMPFHTFFADKYSFPSGHTVLGFAAAGVIFYKFRDWRGWMALSFAAIIGLCRIYEGMHWPTDVMAGIIFGLIASGVTVSLVPRLLPELRDRIQA